MLEKLIWETYRKSNAADRQKFIDEAERMIYTYGWEDRTVMPWEHCELRITTIINDLKTFDQMTSESKSYFIDVVNGLADIMNAWEEHEREPKVTVKSLKSGKIMRISREFAEELAEDGLIKIIA